MVTHNGKNVEENKMENEAKVIEVKGLNSLAKMNKKYTVMGPTEAVKC